MTEASLVPSREKSEQSNTDRAQPGSRERGEWMVAWNLKAGDLQTVCFPVRPGGRPVRQI